VHSYVGACEVKHRRCEGTLAEHCPGTAWHAFLNASVKQFFCIDDPSTAELVGLYLGNQTVAYRSTQTGLKCQFRTGWMMGHPASRLDLRAPNSVSQAHIHLETTAKLLILLGRDSALCSKCALESLNNQADFDSAIRRFDPSRPSQHLSC
jgi:hypothetical protein